MSWRDEPITKGELADILDASFVKMKRGQKVVAEHLGGLDLQLYSVSVLTALTPIADLREALEHD